MIENNDKVLNQWHMARSKDPAEVMSFWNNVSHTITVMSNNALALFFVGGRQPPEQSDPSENWKKG